MSTIKLNVLDQSPAHPVDSIGGLDNPVLMTVALAEACDEFGYSRYWLAEHHNTAQFAGPCPEILIGRIASVTTKMRIGSGGVMLSHYSPYKVAEVFNMLATLFPGRIDLGIGRAPGGDSLASGALAWPGGVQGAESYPQQASLLAALLGDGLPADHPWHNLQIGPENTAAPEVWMLGSSGGSAKLAGQLGLNLALARFISPEHCSPDIFTAHQKAAIDAGLSTKPQGMLAIGAFCASSKEEAEHIAGTAIYRKMMMRSSFDMPLQSPDEVQDKRRDFTVSEEAEYQSLLAAYTVGTPEQCAGEIHSLAKSFACEEITVVNVSYDYATRLETYKLLAEAML